MPALVRTEARAAAIHAADWIVVNQVDDGKFLYDFHRGRGESSDDYNLVRHAGVTMSLYQLVRGGELQLARRRRPGPGVDARAPASHRPGGAWPSPT